MRTALSALSPAGQRGRLSILIFHRVLPQADSLFPDEPCMQRFAREMGWVRDWFNVLPLEEAIHRLKKGQLPARAAAITFDDGYADNYTCAVPILKKLDLHATFFIATGFLGAGAMWNDIVIEAIRDASIDELDTSFLGLEPLALVGLENKRRALSVLIPAIKHRPPAARAEAVEHLKKLCQQDNEPKLMLNESQLICLRDAGMAIGAHTVTHPILATLDPNSVKDEIAGSRDYLEATLKQKVTLFAYPNGKISQDYTEGTASIVRSLGFSAAVSTNWGAADTHFDEFQLPRFTPWDRTPSRYAIRMLNNLRR